MSVADRWERWAPVSGLVFAVSFLVLFFAFLGPGERPASATAAQIADYYRGRGGAGFLLMYSLIGLSGFALLWFTASLRASLQRAHAATGGLSDAAYAGGVASAILLMTWGATLMAPFAVIINSSKTIDPSVYVVLDTMGFLALNLGLFGQAVQVVATSVIALQREGLPVWFAGVGFVVAVALVLNLLYFFGLFVWVAWVLLASVVLLARPIRRVTVGARAGAEGI